MHLPLQKKIGRSSSETLSKSVVVSLEGIVDVLWLVYVSKIRIAEDVGISVVKIRLVKTLVDLQTDEGVLALHVHVTMHSDLYQLMIEYAQLVDPEQINILLFSNSKEKDSIWNSDLD